MATNYNQDNIVVVRYDQNSMDDDFELIDADAPPRYMATDDLADALPDIGIELRPTSTSNEFLLSINPPNRPAGELKHTSCDIVLVIDVSGSMNAAAELPDQIGVENKEVSGHSILDLVKHASRTVLEKLNENDRLAVVTFSSHAKVIQELLPMTASEKKDTWSRIDGLSVQDSTNLWAGIREGLTVLENSKQVGNVQSMFILTDGVPNYMCPSQGYVKKLLPMLKKMKDENGTSPTLSTFGFGYHLRSSLMRSIAEVGHGNYAFIPDVGMIGTVFVHAVANLFSTFATNAEISLECSNFDTKIILPSYFEFDAENQKDNKRVLHMSNVQYGQPRNVIVKIDRAGKKDLIGASVTFNLPGGSRRETSTICDINASLLASEAAQAYHVSRDELCTFLSSLTGRNQNNEYTPAPPHIVNGRLPELCSLIERIEGRLKNCSKLSATIDSTDLAALLADLQSSDPNEAHGSGQISLALRTDDPPPVTPPLGGNTSSHYRYVNRPVSYYSRWGIHYLPSILHAHMRQMCATFKDPGPQRYGVSSPLFIQCRAELDNAFDSLPAPKPTLLNSVPVNQRSRAPVKMGRWNSSRNPCFGGQCFVRMGTEEDNVFGMKVEELRVGDFVWTPAGVRAVEAVVKTDAQVQMMCNFGGKNGLSITPWHPIRHGGQWTFPEDVTDSQQGQRVVMQNISIYSILLERDSDPNAHIIDVGGVSCVTLGHGLTDISNSPDIRSHPFFGDYDLVQASLEQLPKDDCGRRISGGVSQAEEEDGKYAFASGFVQPEKGVSWFAKLADRRLARL